MKFFATIDEARAFLAKQGSGTIEKRTRRLLHGSGHGLERVEYDQPLRITDWRFVERVESTEKPSDNAGAMRGFRIESDYPLNSDWLPESAFTLFAP